MGKTKTVEGKKIEVVEMRVGDIKTGFGNPRKISSAKKADLKESLDNFGDFGLIVIDEHDNVIAGNQRVAVLKEEDEDTIVTCKRLTGYSRAELRAINLKDNTHSGEWDNDLLADWTADLNLDVGIKDNDEENPEEREIPEMELIHYEKYDYVLIACRSVLDYNDLLRKLGLENKKVIIAKKRKINARAIWYDEMKAVLVPNDEYDRLKASYDGQKPEQESEESPDEK